MMGKLTLQKIMVSCATLWAVHVNKNLVIVLKVDLLFFVFEVIQLPFSVQVNLRDGVWPLSCVCVCVLGNVLYVYVCLLSVWL